MKYTITAPNKGYNGISATVQFNKGVGETDSDHLARWFESHGYTVDDTATNDGGEKKEKPLNKMNKAELAAVAVERGIEIPEGATNSDIVKLIEAGE